MIKFVPVPIVDHEAILGKDFNKKFSAFMAEFYAPYQNNTIELTLAKEIWEHGVQRGIPNAVHLGAGKNVIDVRSPIADFDVKGISCEKITSNQSTEASFLQNNKKQNDGFAKLFESQDFNALKQMFVDPFEVKIKDTNNLHMFCIIRDKSTHDVYYCLLKVESSTLTDSEFTQSMRLNGDRSVSVPMIDSVYGRTYIYIPKRRLEIRINPAGLSSFLVYSHSY